MKYQYSFSLGLLKPTILSILLVCGLFEVGFAAQCSTADPILISEKKGMTFAEITAGFAGGTIDTSGNVTGDVAAYKGQINPGQVQIDACKGEIITYSFVDGTLTNGSQTMSLTILTSPGSVTMPASGRLTLDVEASLNVGGLQDPGDYTGNYTIIVNY